MKASLFFSFLFLFLFLFLFTTKSNAGVLLDTTGEGLQNNGGPYYMSAPIVNLGGRIKLAASRHNQNCPLDVLFDQGELNPTFTLTFEFTFQAIHRAGFLGSTDLLLISSRAENPCNESTIWRADESRGNVLTSGGSFPGYCFRMVEPQDRFLFPTYTLEYCPFLCGLSSDSETCFPIYVNRELHLAAGTYGTDAPFEFGLTKVQSPSIAMYTGK